MTVSTTDNEVVYVSGGPAFPIPYRFLQNSDIEAVLVKQDGTSETLTGAQYTIVGAGSQSGGTLTSAYAAGVLASPGASLTINRDMQAVQLTDLRNQGKYLAETHENVFDRLTMLVQQGLSTFARALVRPFGKNYYDAKGYQISNLADPSLDQDAATKHSVDQAIADVLATGQGPINNAANVVYIAPNLSVRTVQDMSSTSDTAKGAALIGYLGRTVFDRLNEVVNIADGPNPVLGNNTLADRNRLLAKLDAAAAAGKPVIIPAKVWQFNDWIPLPDNLKMVFMPGAQWKLTVGGNILGGFVCGGYTSALVPRPFTNVEIYGIDLDCSDLAGQNAMNAINGVNVKLYNPKIRNTKFSNTTQGGKAFQFEGATVDGLHIVAPYIENCTIGINSHADPAGGAEVARNITYYDVVMRNVDVPFNHDGQFANPENGTVTNMSTTVIGVNLFNCGRLTYPGNSGALGSGIVCGDRGYGLKISGLRLVNTAAYGGIAAVFRGTMFNTHFRDFIIQVPSVANVIDWTPVGYGAPSTGGHPCTVDAEDITVKASIGLIARGYANAKMGASRFRINIDSSLGFTNICDAEAASSGLGFLDLTLLNTGSFRTRMQSFASLRLNGNGTGLCHPEYSEGSWTPTDTSGAGLVFTSVSGFYVREGRKITANFTIQFPTTANISAAQLGNLPGTSMNRTETGTVTFAFKAAAALGTGSVLLSSNNLKFYSETGSPVQNNSLSGQTLIGSITYFAQ